MWLVTGALFMEMLDGTILTTALPSMARTFGTTAVALDIGISAYMLALGVLIPASSWLADRFGSRRIFVTAIAIFTLASALCGQAQSVPEFVALRVLQGVGGAMMTPVGRLVVMRHTPRDQLIATLSALIWPALFAPVVGPPVGGFITEHLGWRWIFYFNVPLGILALVAALWLIPDVRGAPAVRLDRLLAHRRGVFSLQIGFEHSARRIDALGLGLSRGPGRARPRARLRRSPIPCFTSARSPRPRSARRSAAARSPAWRLAPCRSSCR
jgi:MFS family permease